MEITKHVEQYRKDLMLKNYSPNTIENYVSQVTGFLHHFNAAFTDVSRINENAIKDWLMLAKSINSRKHRISAVKLFYHLTVKQPLKFKHIEYPRADKKLPIVLSQQEIQRMFDVCENLKHRCILALLYACGIRVSELINLKWKNIDRSRMVINIIAAKGNKDRQVQLPSSIIPLLEQYYRKYRSVEYVFNGQNNNIQYTSISVRQLIKQLAEKAEIKHKRIYTHLIRHTSATHLLENGVDVSIIQKILGHSNPNTTALYTHISHNLISKTYSPIEGIRIYKTI